MALSNELEVPSVVVDKVDLLASLHVGSAAERPDDHAQNAQNGEDGAQGQDGQLVVEAHREDEAPEPVVEAEEPEEDHAESQSSDLEGLLVGPQRVVGGPRPVAVELPVAGLHVGLEEPACSHSAPASNSRAGAEVKVDVAPTLAPAKAGPAPRAASQTAVPSRAEVAMPAAGILAVQGGRARPGEGGCQPHLKRAPWRAKRVLTGASRALE
eukprot:CAMPEP_0197938044 /NCGR_PEP_ID=MMETSP1439-20131203/117496_1 /TAXON_ID=66791 /ORGANISM="Gonyaulax spinifera, Strain CCMP409" /LENGTH=211 /DNA_ID=CAMNT_0043561097 /DNA_START=57 /DNA_END=691 /DNA_ORIENTATION=-